MITTPSGKKSLHDIAAFIITLPYLAIDGAIKITAAVLAKGTPIKKAVAIAAPEVTPPKAEPKTHLKALQVADRVHSEYLGTLKVSFFYYGTEQFIRATARKNGVVKEVLFTADNAKSASLPFSFAGAVMWLRKKNGFKGLEEKSATVVAPTASTHTQSSAATSVPADAQYPQSAALMAKSMPAVRPPKSSAKRPQTFEGTVLSYGETQKPGMNGKPPYTTYQLTLWNDGIGQREFIGEHLAELVLKHDLGANDHVRLHSLGKREFEIEVNGEIERRHRNEYAIDILKR